MTDNSQPVNYNAFRGGGAIRHEGFRSLLMEAFHRRVI